jgi:hypothetical protein
VDADVAGAGSTPLLLLLLLLLSLAPEMDNDARRCDDTLLLLLLLLLAVVLLGTLPRLRFRKAVPFLSLTHSRKRGRVPGGRGTGSERREALSR